MHLMKGYGYVDESTLDANYVITHAQHVINSINVQHNNNMCSCDSGYYEYQSQLQCLQCHYSCQTCDSQGPYNCLSCNYDLGRELNNSQCQCSSGFYQFYKICTPCFYTCVSCVNQFQDGCTSCLQSRQLQNCHCICKSVAQLMIEEFQNALIAIIHAKLVMGSIQTTVSHVMIILVM
ncbi:hypothetical protein pb186bvf_019867 [Paramecium bursaria]